MSKPLAKDLQVKTFDYEGIDPEVKSKLIWLAGEAARQTKTHIESAIELGRVITDAHGLLAGAGRDGQFGSWLMLELGISRSTATNYMRSYEKFNKFTSLVNFSAEAIYALAGPDIPPAAVKEAQKKAEKGVRVNVKVAKEIIERFRVVHKKAESNGRCDKEVHKACELVVEEGTTDESVTADDEESFDPAAIEAEPTGVDVTGPASPKRPAVTELSPDEKREEWNRAVEIFARSITAFSESAPQGGWWDETQANIVAQQLKSAAGAARQVKCSNICPLCDGEGCDRCKGTGFMPKRTFEMVGK